ncbi:MAG: Ser-Thr-rich GPI-anchored membrane family protein [Promethearchaeota archaeon]
MRYKSKFKFFVLLIIGILIVNIFMGEFVLRNTANPKIDELTSIKSSGTFTVTVASPYGGFAAEGNVRNENDYLEWSISTIYGPGFTFYMMNNTELFAYLALASTSRTRGNFAYTELLSDEEASASGTFYPTYSDTWWFVVTNHYTGTACSADFVTNWNDDFITVDEPTNSRSWEANTSHYIDWTSGGDFAHVDIDLYHDGNFLRNIATNAQNNGSYLWKLPTDISLFDDLYQVNISNADFDGTWGISDSYFEITGETTISVTSPFTSNSWEMETAHFINWTSSGNITDVKIELFKDDIFELEIISSTANDGEYSWSIPSGLDNSTQYQIKITDVSNSSIYDFSDYFEIYVTNSITVLSPDNLSSWETETLHSISWTSTGSIADVKIELFKEDVFELEIISSTANDGEYSWAIPSGLDDSTQYQIKLTDESNALTFNFSEYFEIYIPDSITVLSPDSLSSWETETTHSITWTSTGSIADVKIELFKDDVFESEIISSTANDGEYSWVIPSGLDDSTQYQIKLIDVSNALTFNFSEYFEIYIPDSITVLSPNSLSSWETETTHSITWTSTGSITDVKIELFKDDVFESEIISSTPNDGEFSWVIPSGFDNSTQYQIKVTDLSNSLIYDYGEYFEIFTSPTSTTIPEIPGYDLILLFGTSGIGVCGIVLFILRKKKQERIA